MRPKVKDLPVESVKRLLKAPNRQTTMGRRDSAILALLGRGGPRVGELCNLKVGDAVLDGPNPVLIVKTLKRRKPHKREIPLTAETVSLLRAYLRSRNGSGPEAPLFLTTAVHGPWRPCAVRPHVVTRIVRKAAARAKIIGRLTPHSLRHVFATSALRSGVDLKTVQALLGHASIGSTEVYLHTNATRMAEAVKGLPF